MEKITFKPFPEYPSNEFFVKKCKKCRKKLTKSRVCRTKNSCCFTNTLKYYGPTQAMKLFESGYFNIDQLNSVFKSYYDDKFFRGIYPSNILVDNTKKKR